jgi:cytochrome c
MNWKANGLPIRQSTYWLLSALMIGLAACSLPWRTASPAPTFGGDPVRGQLALRSYGCHTCHAVPGIPGAQAMVGPPLEAWAERRYIAGSLPNEPVHLIEWIRFPQSIEPGTAMPDLGVTEQDARDMAAYLYTLRSQ